MATFNISFYGFAVIRPLRREGSNYISREYCVRIVESELRNYWPMYYSASIWEVSKDHDGNDQFTLVAELSANISVTVERKDQ